MIFYAFTKSDSRCGLEEKYNFFRHDYHHFAGFDGKVVIASVNGQWTFKKMKFKSEEMKIIGFVRKERDPLGADLSSIIGINLINCYNSEKNESTAELF